MMKALISLLGVLLSLKTTQAQTIDVDTCIGPLAAATACVSYQSILTECNSYTGSKAAACYCPQTVLNAIAGCQGEFRICLEGYDFDSEFEGSDGLFGLWHSACDEVLTYTPTTPAITSLSLTFDPANCLSAQSYCQDFGSMTDACTVASANNLRSCICQETVLELASRCQIDGSISCAFRTPTSTNLFSYKNCAKSMGSSVGTTSTTSTQLVVTSKVTVMTSNPTLSSNPTSTLMPTATTRSAAQRTFQLPRFVAGLSGLLVLYVIWC